MKFFHNILIIAVLVGISGCKNRNNQQEPADTVVKTPVTISAVEFNVITETISLNATSVYLRKNEIKSNVNGYVERVYVGIGDEVKAGVPLFKIRTKEAEALGQFNTGDSLLSIQGGVMIFAPASGIVASITAQENSYVNDGDVTASMADQKSFVFILHVPYELRGYTRIGTPCQVYLPDSAKLDATITSRLPEVDPLSQTQGYIVTCRVNPLLPENLVVTIVVNRNTSVNAQILDKACVLSDETMENFWVMQVINDSTAVKVRIKKGISTDSKVEILEPVFVKGDRFVNSGSYGLSDTANIVISK
jgi:hypothetical protein